MSHDTELEIQRALGRIEGKLVEISTLPERVNSLERWRSWILGGMALISFGVILLGIYIGAKK